MSGIRLRDGSDKERFAAACKELRKEGITVALSEKAIDAAQAPWVGDDEPRKYDHNGNFSMLNLSHDGIAGTKHADRIFSILHQHGFVVEWDGSQARCVTVHGQRAVADLRELARYDETTEKYDTEAIRTAHSTIYRELERIGVNVKDHYALRNAIGDLYSKAQSSVYDRRRRSFDAQHIAWNGGDDRR